MVEATLMAISMMWFPIGLLLLGKGEPKGTGALTLMVGTLVLVSAVIQAAVFKDRWIAALLFAYGLFYCIVGYTLYAGLENMQAAGNASFTLIPISIIYMILSLTGGPVLEGGKQLVGKSSFLALACAGYTVLYIMADDVGPEVVALVTGMVLLREVALDLLLVEGHGEADRGPGSRQHVIEIGGRGTAGQRCPGRDANGHGPLAL